MAYSPQQSLRNAHGGGATAVHEVRPCSAAIMDKKMIYIYISQVKSMLRWSLKENLWSPSTEPWNKSPGCKEKSKRSYGTCVFWWWKECNWRAKLQKFTDCRWTSSRHLFWTKLAVVSKASVSVHPPGFGSSCPAVQQNLWNHNMLLYYYAKYVHIWYVYTYIWL